MALTVSVSQSITSIVRIWSDGVYWLATRWDQQRTWEVVSFVRAAFCCGGRFDACWKGGLLFLPL